MQRNVLFIMCDQLRYDYLSCYGHPSLKTPHIDSLAARGVRFTNAYVQSPMCGPSRMSTYTGRYVRSHGSTWNAFPLRVGELGIGDHLAPLGVRTALCGKSHMVADRQGMEHFNIDPVSELGRRTQECGFETWDRLDGLHPSVSPAQAPQYVKYLQSVGYDTNNPWEQNANAPEGDQGEALSAWQMTHANRPARIAAEHSETAYSTTRAIEFIDDAGDQPWCLHLSYIKPHWPYVAPAPYHDMYGEDDISPVVRSADEQKDPHPLFGAFQNHRVSKVFAKPGVREKVIPVYMGMIKQIDDNIGRLLAHLEATGLDKNTMIVFTSDHGDYLGDHWLGEKELFHDCSVKMPLIVVDPSPDADMTRGKTSDALVESIDLAPTFVDYFGGAVPAHILEGQSLMSLLQGENNHLKDIVISEFDYSTRQAREQLNVPVKDCRMQMIFDGQHKLINVTGFRPMLFDLHDDPDELNDLGAEPTSSDVITKLRSQLLDWALQHHNRTTVTDQQIEGFRNGEIREGIYIGCWDDADIDEINKTGVSGY